VSWAPTDSTPDLHHGLAAIRAFVGAKLLLQGFGVHVPIVVSLLVILVAMTASIGASLIATRRGKSSRKDDKPDEADTGSDWYLKLVGRTR
jgi:predicted tellurium resistance membrane protein TerC